MMQFLLSLVLIGEAHPDVGTSGFAFLKVAPSAREAALAATAIGRSDNAFGLWYNPAGLALQDARQLGVSYLSYVGGVQSGAVSFAAPGGPVAFGVGGYYLTSPSMKRTDENGIEYGTFSASYLDLSGAVAFRVGEKLRLGTGLKALYGGIDSFWTLGLAADIGASYDLPVNGLRAGLAARHLGATLKPFLSQREKLPMDFAFGLGFRPVEAVDLGLELHKPMDNNIDLRAGAEVWLHRYFCLRLGLTTAGSDLKAQGGADILAGLATGLGVRVRQFELDYSFTPMVILDNAHRVSFRYTFR